MTFHLTSSAFRDGQMIPATYSANGADHSPPLAWSGQPPATVSLALICDDPDAPRGTWVHWLLFNLPGDTGGLAEHTRAPDGTLPNGAHQGKNDFGKLGYGGPASRWQTASLLLQAVRSGRQVEAAGGSDQRPIAQGDARPCARGGTLDGSIPEVNVAYAGRGFRPNATY